MEAGIPGRPWRREGQPSGTEQLPKLSCPSHPGVLASSDVRRVDLWLFPADRARVLSLFVAHRFRRTVQRLWEVLSLPSVASWPDGDVGMSCGASAWTPPALRTSPPRGWGCPACSSR